jgi:hypothetical protein
MHRDPMRGALRTRQSDERRTVHRECVGRCGLYRRPRAIEPMNLQSHVVCEQNRSEYCIKVSEVRTVPSLERKSCRRLARGSNLTIDFQLQEQHCRCQVDIVWMWNYGRDVGGACPANARSREAWGRQQEWGRVRHSLKMGRSGSTRRPATPT